MSIFHTLRSLNPFGLADLRRRRRLNARHALMFGDPSVQTLLLQRYNEMAYQRRPLEDLNLAGFRIFSAADEDGILLYLFGMLGMGKRTFVDIGAAGVEGSSTANLIVHHGWHGLHMEMYADALRFGQKFYRSRGGGQLMPPTPVPGAVNAENVNDIIGRNGLSGDIDFLSIDIDGIDYWVWKALDVVSPRVVEMEIQVSLGNQCKTVPYDPAFNRSNFEINVPPYDILYCGASLPALVKLGEEKGYDFVGCDNYRTNAFFVRKDVNQGLLPRASVESMLDHPRVHEVRGRSAKKVDALNWQEV
jgi:hypothetical protein